MKQRLCAGQGVAGNDSASSHSHIYRYNIFISFTEPGGMILTFEEYYGEELPRMEYAKQFLLDLAEKFPAHQQLSIASDFSSLR